MQSLSAIMANPARGFLSDNASPVLPEVMEALAACNAGHMPSYGEDEVTAAAGSAFDALFGRPVSTFFVFNGTAANATALALCAPHGYDVVICSDVSHIHTDECAAPEHMAGVKLLALPTPDGKLTPVQVEAQLGVLGNMHHAQPRVLSLTQCTELGTVYTPAEVAVLAQVAHRKGLLVHMDGARIANATASLGCDAAAFTCDAGVDILSFGCTKNGLMFGEAVVVFDAKLAEAFPFVRKNNGQQASKMRYIAAQYLAILQDGLWLKTAAHTNAMAQKLAEALGTIGLTPVHPVEANEVFLHLPKPRTEAEAVALGFHLMDEAAGLARFVLSWDSREEDILRVAETLRGLMA